MTDHQGRKPVIGLTGPIGAGKTLVASLLRDLGCAVINADHLAHQILAEPAGKEFVRDQFGRACMNVDGTVNRKALAQIVFSDPHRKQQLEDFIYPSLHERRRRLLAQYQADGACKAVVLEAPLLIETGLKHLCDHVIIVMAERAVREERVGKDRQWDPAELTRREKFFLPIYLKRSVADDIVWNNSTVDECRRQVERIFSRIVFSETNRLA